MREYVLSGTSWLTLAASYPLAAVNDWLQLVSLVVSIISSGAALYLMTRKRR